MCLLLVASPNSTPHKKDLECASCNNPHGFGYAVITPNGIVTGRGMSAKKIIKEFLSVRKEFPASYAMFHARFATHGVKNEENCHPFKVSEQTYLAHNGILDVEIHTTDRRSDTRVFAEDVLPAMGGVSALDDANVWKILSRWSVGSKIVIFTLDPKAKDVCYILNEESGHWDNEGIWWSNTTYRESTWSHYVSLPFEEKYKSIDRISDYTDEDVTCPTCLTVMYENANPYFCEVCNQCFDCEGIYQDTCLCWTPETDKYASNRKGMMYNYNGNFNF